MSRNKLYEYQYFLPVDRNYDPHVHNAVTCQIVENEMKLHLQDINKVTDFLTFNCSANLDDAYTDIRLNKIHFADICWVYKEIEKIIFPWAKENDELLNKTRFLFSRLLTSHDVFTFRDLVQSYDEVIKHVNSFTRKKELLYNFISSRNLSCLLNTSYRLNYSDCQTKAIELMLREYNDWKNILIENKNGTRYDVFMFVRIPLYSLVVIIGLNSNVLEQLVAF